MRPGEFLSCNNVPGNPCGCGTGESCRECGLVGAVLASRKSEKTVEQECLLTVQRNGTEAALELRVRASPLRLGDELFTFVSLRDISDSKRRQVLERLFLHDVRNTAAGLLGWAQFLVTRTDEAAAEFETRKAVPRILRLAQRLNRELQDQHDLVLAEAGSFEPEFSPVPVATILEEAAEIFAASHYAEQRSLEVEAPDPSLLIETDPRLVVRVLANMLKNAFEATRRGGRIRLGGTRDEAGWSLFVQNEGVLDPVVRRHVFQRSYSTKSGPGRGLGTYSMKLFGERYLGGTVSFTSNPEEGTVFFIRLPEHGRTGQGQA
jgi:signal transduction histidine kinase